ncbi:PREDICTED: thioredoxin domain-containing protein 16 isoform X2 [Corvus brachyrhynchos]|uniref:thioredoxin domain-containing protein 16 isoform X2 n=1 Tax=Corvus brachyrhynchos TaxID=85066 RepID=UPI00081669F5|nr:PREDICTED: thioredoxin domain-containing protein 16 isoform X2 [Corvus brachyrhynchos]
MSAQKDRWVSSFVFLLFCASSIPRSGSVGLQQELSPQHYFSGLEAGKASLAFFTPSVSPGAQPFLEQIESSAEALQDYGISVVKVNCPKEDASRYCGRENALRKAFLFRGNRLIREFPTDALFDVNSVVANVLFALLFNEVKYVETLADLENTENVLKGKSNMVFAYVPATGTAEHRAVMEAAFVYGTTHQFVLTTEAALLKATSHDDPDVSSAWLLFCHCQLATDPAQPCRRTALGQPLTLLNIHRHLKLMGAPLVTEVAEDPEKVSTVHLQLGLPLVFILSQKETYEADRRTAEFVAWQLLGKAGVALLSRDLVDLNVLHRSNIALKTPDEGMPIQYLVLEDTDEVITLVEDKSKVKQIQEDEEEEEDEDEEENNNQDIQDDQVVEAVSRDKKRELPLEQVLVLTEENFHSSLSEAAPTVVLFYASWEAVSLAVLRSYSEVAAHLKAKAAFEEAGNILSGHVRMGMYFEDDALALSRKYSVSPPALLLARSGGRSVEGIALSKHSVQDVVQMIRCELLDIFPEITVPNLPQYLQLRKPFLILFSAGGISQMESKEMLKLAKGGAQQAFVACWLNLKKTPVGHGILRKYFSTTPSLPVLLWVNLHAGGQVFKFPPEQSITEMNILSWLEKLQAGLEIPSSTLSEEDWKPPLPAYDFLQMMEPSVPELSARSGDTAVPHPPKSPEGDTAATGEEPPQESTAEEVGSPGRDLRGTASRLAARDKQGKRHSEL